MGTTCGDIWAVTTGQCDSGAWRAEAGDALNSLWSRDGPPRRPGRARHRGRACLLRGSRRFFGPHAVGRARIYQEGTSQDPRSLTGPLGSKVHSYLQLDLSEPPFEVTACRDGSSPAPAGEFLLTFWNYPRTASASAADADVSRRKERRAPRSPAPDLGRPVRPAAAPSAPSRLFPPAWPLGDTRPAHRRTFPQPPAALGSDPRPFAPPHPQSSSCLREAVRGVPDGGEGVTARAPAGRPLTGSHTRERPVN